MIQRIQSLYLLLIAALLIAVLFVPFGAFQTLNETYEYTAFSIKQVVAGVACPLPVWILAVVSIAASVLALANIFFYKKRQMQIRLCLSIELLLVTFYLVYASFTYLASSDLKANYSVGFGVALPMLAMILDLLAIHAIRKDEALVKSWDRIR